MNAKKLIAIVVGFSILTSVSKAQGTFQNLDFEAANVSGYSPGGVPSGDAVPGWTIYLGNTESGQALYNYVLLGTATVDILSTQFGGVIDGQFTAFLQSGTDSQSGGQVVSASIEQSGTVPANAQSLQFEAANQSQLLTISFDGNSLSAVVLGSGQGVSPGLAYTLYGVNIGPYDGQTGELEFTENGGGNVNLDDISFSTNAVPEPSTLVLVVMGGAVCGLRRRRMRASAVRQHKLK